MSSQRSAQKIVDALVEAPKEPWPLRSKRSAELGANDVASLGRRIDNVLDELRARFVVASGDEKQEILDVLGQVVEKANEVVNASVKF